MFKLQQLNEVKQNQKGYTFSIRIDLTNIYISFEEFKQESIKLNENRYLGIDLNPDTIGISVLENDKVIYRSVWEAAASNNIKKQAISRCCKNNAKAGKLRYRLQDYYFVYVDK